MTSMTAVELQHVREALRQRLANLERIKPTCAHCEHFANSSRCAKFDAVPPQEFQLAEGACPEWRFDGVPF